MYFPRLKQKSFAHCKTNKFIWIIIIIAIFPKMMAKIPFFVLILSLVFLFVVCLFIVNQMIGRFCSFFDAQIEGGLI